MTARVTSKPPPQRKDLVIPADAIPALIMAFERLTGHYLRSRAIEAADGLEAVIFGDPNQPTRRVEGSR